jgi:hypothetical protein
MDGGRPRTTLTNIITNGDFADGGSWTPANGTEGVASNIYSLTGNGDDAVVSTSQETGTAAAENKKVYIKLLAKVTNAVCSSITVTMDGSTAGTETTVITQDTPTSSRLYELEGILTTPADFEGNYVIAIKNTYADAATANAKVLQIEKVMAIDLTALWSGVEPTAAQMNRWLQQFAGYNNLSKLYSNNNGTITTTGTTSTNPSINYSYKLSAGGYSTPTTVTASSIALPASGVERVELKATVSGNTITNLLTDAVAGCEATTGWTIDTTVISTDSDNEFEGTNCLKTTISGASGMFYRNILSVLDTSKYYFISSYIKNGNITGGLRLLVSCTGDTGTSASSYITSTSYTRVGAILQPTGFDGASAVNIIFQASSNGTNTQYAFVDAIMVQEITATEYALGATALLTKYAWHLGTAHTTPQTITTDGKTATTPITLRSNATVQDSYNMDTGIHIQRVNSSTYETLATQIITQYGKGSFIDTTKTIPKRIY